MGGEDQARAKSAKPRVLVLTTTFPASEKDGSPSFVLDICQSLVSNFDILVVTPAIPGARSHDDLSRVEVRRFRFLGPFNSDLARGSILENARARPHYWLQVPFFMVSFWLASFRALRIFRPDVVHAHWILPGGLIARLLPKVPRVITSHGSDVYALRSPLARYLRTWALQESEVSVVNSDMKKKVQAIAPNSPVRVIPGGLIDLKPSGATRKPRHVLFVARMVPKKGLQYLLEAQQNLDCILHVVGDGPLLDYYKGLAGPRVTFHGQQSKERVFSWMESCEILVLPSLQEGMPVTLMEACAAGIAVVATNLPGVVEMIKDGEDGILVPPEDSGAIQDALTRLLETPGLSAQMGQKLQQKANRFSRETVAGQYSDLLHQALAKEQGRTNG